MRLFLAIALPARLRQTLQSLQPNADKKVRLVAGENMHLTLHFFAHADAKIITRALAGFSFRAFHLTLEKTGCFEKGGKGALWAGIKKSDRLVNLQQKIADPLARAGLHTHSGKFTPHITLARYKQGYTIEQHFLEQQFSGGEFLVDRFFLFHSETRPEGPKYTALAKFKATSAAPKAPADMP